MNGYITHYLFSPHQESLNKGCDLKHDLPRFILNKCGSSASEHSLLCRSRVYQDTSLSYQLSSFASLPGRSQ